MQTVSSPASAQRHVSIWWWAFGYFAAYAPYSALAKALSDGKLGPAKISGNAILPVSTLSSVFAMLAFIGFTGWWRAAGKRTVAGFELPWPTRWTTLSGLAGATILTTTTLAYTFEGVSIVFMMLLMRGGVLAMAPLIDLLSGRKVRWYSWVALGLTMVSLIAATVGRVDLRVSGVAMLNVAAYLTAYFVRLRFMSRLAKSDDPAVTRRYFVEEQLVSTPSAFLALGLLALVGSGESMGHIRDGFTQVPFSWAVPFAIVIGVLSQGTGVFGALVLLDKSENSFSVPVNRASSVMAGVVATFALWAFVGGKMIDPHEAIGAGLVVAAIIVLSVAPGWEKRQLAKG